MDPGILIISTPIGGSAMLMTIAVILVILWLLGLVTSYTCLLYTSDAADE